LALIDPLYGVPALLVGFLAAFVPLATKLKRLGALFISIGLVPFVAVIAWIAFLFGVPDFGQKSGIGGVEALHRENALGVSWFVLVFLTYCVGIVAGLIFRRARRT
jgi:hypothetical protein